MTRRRAVIAAVGVVLAAAVFASAEVARSSGNETAGTGVPAATAKTSDCGKHVKSYRYGPDAASDVVAATWNTCRKPGRWAFLIHGGGWHSNNPLPSELLAHWYAAGFQVFAPDFREGADPSWPVEKSDVLSAYDWITKHAAYFHLAAQRGIVFGTSSGGHIAAWVANTRHVAGAISLSGVLQPQRIADDDNGLRPTTEPANASMHRNHLNMIDVLGCDWTRTMTAACKQRWLAFMPQTGITSTTSRMYLIQGNNDQICPPRIADAYGYWLGQHHVPHRVVHVPHATHGLDILADIPSVESAMIAWAGRAAALA